MRKPLAAASVVIAVVFTTYLVYYSPLNKAVVLNREIDNHSRQALDISKDLFAYLESLFWDSRKLDKQIDQFKRQLKNLKRENQKTIELLKVASSVNLSDDIQNKNNALSTKIGELSDVLEKGKLVLNKLRLLSKYIGQIKQATAIKKQADDLLNQSIFDLNMEYYDSAREEGNKALELYKKSLSKLNQQANFTAGDIENLKKALEFYIKAARLISKSSSRVQEFNAQIVEINSLISRGQQFESNNDYYSDITSGVEPSANWLNKIIQNESIGLKDSLKVATSD